MGCEVVVAATNDQLDLAGVGPAPTENLWLLRARPVAARASTLGGMLGLDLGGPIQLG